MKNTLNILSYLLNIVLIIILVWNKCDNKPIEKHDDPIVEAVDTLQLIKDKVLAKERAELPLRIQEFEHVHNITIDSLVLTSTAEPYSGYLVTTWDLDEQQPQNARQWAANGYKDKFIRKTKEVYVGVMYVYLDHSQWFSHWEEAYFQVKESDDEVIP